MKTLLFLSFFLASLSLYSQVDTSYIYNPDAPYGALDIRISKSSSRYYYLQEGKTFSFRESSAGVKTNTYRDMTSWDSSPYTQGNLREKNGTSDAFIMNYRLLFPAGYQANYAAGYPLIVMMHGAGERGNCWEDNCFWADRSWRPATNTPPAPTSSTHQLLNNDNNMSHGGKAHLDARNLAGTKLPNDPTLNPRAFPGFVLFPQNMNGWDTPTAQDAIRIVRLAIKKYNIDPDRIYIHGLSNGGIAVYNVIKRAPWLFAAALPMSSPSDGGIFSAGVQSAVAHIPMWMFQGGKDTAPEPSRTAGYVRKFRLAGAEVRYSLYDNLGHGTWNTAYAEGDFFSWMLSKSKTRVHVFFGNTSICGTTGDGVKLGLAAGFLAYQWEKNGSIISGAGGHEYIATQPAVYRARFSRQSRNPSEGEWEEWSQEVTITDSGAKKAGILPLTTTHLRGPDDATPNTIELTSTVKADMYFWYKNGALINIPENDEDDTVSILRITGTATTNNGTYTLKIAGLDGCQSTASDPIDLFFNNSAPLLADSNVPGSFRLVSATGSTANLAWEDRSTAETAYEIWRRTPGEVFTMVGRTAANAVSFTDKGLIPSTTYEYKIRVLNNNGRSRYAPADDVATNLIVTTQSDTQAPTAPRNLKVVRNTINSISLAWTASTDNNGIKHYVVYYGSQSTATNSTEPSFILDGLPMNSNYNITVKALDHGGLLSPASNQVAGTTSVTGLWYGHSTGAWTDLDQITNWDDPEFTGWVPNFTLAPRTQEEYFNFEFTGYLFIQTAGSYFFYLNSDDGSRLFIDGNMVVDFDGVHGRSAANERFGIRSATAIPLSAGPHEIRARFFEYVSGQSLSVAYQGADTGNGKLLIPTAALTSGEGSGSTNTPPVISITSPQNQQQFTEPASVSIAANASDADGNVTKVEFYNGTSKLGEDATSPYTFAWNNVAAGTYSIVAKATDNEAATNSKTVEIIVTGGEGCTGTGRIQQEVWTGISGTLISSIPTESEPSSTTDLTIFEGGTNIADNYGSRIRGYICAPASGTYIFWISGNDRTELWLSSDENPANKRMIASAGGYTNVREWTKYATQQSAGISLVANKKYYVEALHKEGSGSDHVAVGWQLPGGVFERPIPGIRLMPFGGSSNITNAVVNITNPGDGETFRAPASVSIEASASISEGSITKVEFYNGTAKLGEDATSPYTFIWNDVQAGSYTIVAQAIDDSGTSTTDEVDITVSDGSACAGTGTVLREIWTGVSGTDVGSIPVNSAPDGSSELTIFEDLTNVGDNYATRVSGYLCVPTTGAYTFWISSNDHSELSLSTDSDPGNKRRIAYVSGYTNVRQWTKFSTQQSSPINLVAGQTYYIEALHKEGVGSDHMAVGWQLPDGSLERPIPGGRLSPATSDAAAGFEATTMTDATMMTSTQADDATLEIFPNPAPEGITELVISGSDAVNEARESKVEILRMTGEVVHTETISCEINCDEYTVSIQKTLSPGVYLVSVITNGKRQSRRLLVK
jgi:hypothetical protein